MSAHAARVPYLRRIVIFVARLGNYGPPQAAFLKSEELIEEPA